MIQSGAQIKTAPRILRGCGIRVQMTVLVKLYHKYYRTDEHFFVKSGLHVGQCLSILLAEDPEGRESLVLNMICKFMNKLFLTN